jgi:hypothetical protein
MSGSTEAGAVSTRCTALAAMRWTKIEDRLERHSAQLGYTTAYCFSIANGFAVNRRYHPGEKRLLAYLGDLPSRPEWALEDLTKLCGLVGSLASPTVEHVSLMLQRLDEWLSRIRPGTEARDQD